MHALDWRRGIAVALMATACLYAHAAELRVISTPAMKPVLDELAPLFRAMKGHTLAILYAPEDTLLKRVKEGEPVDLVIAPLASVNALVKDRRIERDAVEFVGRSRLGLAVRAGATHPDISTQPRLRETLLAAKSVAYPDPVTGDANGKQVTRILDRLNIVGQVRPKSVFPAPPHVRVGSLVAGGAAQVGIDQFLNLAQVEGIDIVGALPIDLQDALVMSVGVIKGTKNLDLAPAFLEFLRTPQAASAMLAKGLSPANI